MDGLMMTENPDTSTYAKQLAEKTAEEPDPQKELLYEKLSELPEDDQKLYRLYFTGRDRKDEGRVAEHYLQETPQDQEAVD